MSDHSTAPAADTITATTLSGGMALVVEKIPGVKSAGLTWLVPAGSARDPEGMQGLSAMYAELLLRGAGSLDSRGQADAFDRLGATRDTNVETYHLALRGSMLGARLPEALPLFADMVRRPRFAAESVEPSRDLCLQALAGLVDDPQERVMIELRRHHAPAPINRSSMGTEEGVRAVTREALRPEWEARACAKGSVLAIAGDVEPGAAAEHLEVLLEGWGGEAPEVMPGERTDRGYHHIPDQTSQVHIALAHDAPAEPEPESWLERAVTAVLSGGMSGRLFTEVREKRSLCYSVYASYGAARDYGRTVAYVGTTPERAQESLDVLTGELRRLGTGAGRVTEQELARAKVGMKSRLVMSGESTGARSGALARDWAKLGRARSLDELAAQVDALTLDDVNAYLGRRDLGDLTVVSIGPEPLRMPE